jgi:hypothetical protein
MDCASSSGDVGLRYGSSWELFRYGSSSSTDAEQSRGTSGTVKARSGCRVGFGALKVSDEVEEVDDWLSCRAFLARRGGGGRLMNPACGPGDVTPAAGRWGWLAAARCSWAVCSSWRRSLRMASRSAMRGMISNGESGRPTSIP